MLKIWNDKLFKRKIYTLKNILEIIILWNQSLEFREKLSLTSIRCLFKKNYTSKWYYGSKRALN